MWKTVHPIRATLAMVTWLATIYFMAVGLVIPDAWWVAFGGVSVYYFTGTHEG